MARVNGVVVDSLMIDDSAGTPREMKTFLKGDINLNNGFELLDATAGSDTHMARDQGLGDSDVQANFFLDKAANASFAVLVSNIKNVRTVAFTTGGVTYTGEQLIESSNLVRRGNGEVEVAVQFRNATGAPVYS